MMTFASTGRVAKAMLPGRLFQSPSAILLTLAMTATTLAGCPGGPAITVFPSGFNFGTSIVQDNLTIINDGTGEVNWTISGLPDWLTVSATAGTATPGNASTVTMFVDRDIIPPGTTSEEFVVQSNAGDVVVSVSVERAVLPVPTLGVDPDALNFGNQAVQRTLSIINLGVGNLDWTITSNDPALELAPANGTTTSSPTSVTVTLNRAGIAPGTYNAELSVTSNGGDLTVPVTYIVDSAAPLLAVSPVSLNFGDATTSLTFAVDNTGTGSLDYTITDDAPWLTVNPAAGSATSEVDTITATVSRAGLTPGTFTATITVDGGAGGTATVDVSMVVGAPTLVVSPLKLSFGTSFTTRLFTISNGGTGQVDWSIDTSGFPAWLSVNVTSGSVTTESDGVIVTVDRTGLPPGPLSFGIPVNSSTPGAGSATVQVNATVGTEPVLSVLTGAVNPPPDEDPLANLGSTATQFQFTISNTGTGTLNWTIDPAQFPGWLLISPVQGTLNAGQSQFVQITVSRAGLGSGGYTADIVVDSNANTVTLEVQMQVPLRPEIGVSASEIDFGIEGISAEFGVANFGDPGTLLLFRIESDKEWLFFSPDRGTSIGTASPIKDFQTIAVAIDRGNLDGTGATGTLTITARDFDGNILPDVAPVQVVVSVEAAELRLEGAVARTRVPSLVRYPFIMRDFRDLAIVVTPDQIGAESFIISEKDVPLELTESNQFLTPGVFLRTNVIVLMDYSGSIFNAASQAGIGGADPLQTLYEQEVSEFITNAPSNWQIALMEFHDRGQPTRLVHDFSTDKTSLINALQGINVIDHGASELLVAIDDARRRFIAEDVPFASFDDADVRALVLLTDGRVTTPPGNVLDTIDSLEESKVRVFAVGWGIDVNNEPLARMASGSGGHYYTTLNTAGGLPQPAEFSNRTEQVLDDLESQLVLSYTSLNETSNTPVRFTGVFDNPNDNPDQGAIQGTTVQVLHFDEIVGDTKLGQISMRSSGVSGGESTVVVRADYVPRTINEFLFTLTSTEAFTVSLVPEADGGLIDDWTLTNEGGGVFRMQSPGGEFLPYGAFGDLLNVTFVGPAVPFRLELFVDETIYATLPEPKEMLFPDGINVEADGARAPAFPTPLVTPLALVFGSGQATQQFTIQNIGGSHLPSNVRLRWEIGSTPTFVLNVAPNEGLIESTDPATAQTVTVFADRTVDPGTYTDSLIIEYDTGDLDDAFPAIGIAGTVSVECTITVTPPVLNVSPTVLNFGAATDDIDISIANTGQSTLEWVIDDTTFPAFLSVSRTSGNVTTSAQTVTVSVDRTGLASGTSLDTQFTVISNGGSQVVTITGTVP